MEIDLPNNDIRKLQDQLRDSMVGKIQRQYFGARMSILLSTLTAENNIDTRDVHPETIRALCHYLSVLVGETTATAILFVPEANTVWIDDGYDSHNEVVENEFIVVPRADAPQVKRRPTRESLTEYDILRRQTRC